jgi:hypothetical protein
LDTPSQKEDLLSDVANMNVQSNISERYKSLHAVMQLYGPRYGADISVLDVGCSQNHGLKRLGLGVGFTEVDEAGDVGVNAALSKPSVITRGLGVDVVPITDRSKQWARACSFYPSELLDEAKVHLYDKLNAAELPTVGFECVDLLTQDLPEKFTIIFASTFMYQLSATDRIHMQQKFRSLLAPNGIIVYQDFVEINRTSPTGLHFYDDWHGMPYQYRTVIEDSALWQHELKELYQWENGRCMRVQAGADLLRIRASLN